VAAGTGGARDVSDETGADGTERGERLGSTTIRVYWYSQTGQLHDALRALVAPVERAGVRVHWHEVRPRTAYPFPWPVTKFFGLFPAASDPAVQVDLEQPPPPPEEGDLVILGYQVWFLTASLPMRAVLQSGILHGHSVIGVTACRDMWYSAALDMQRRLKADRADCLGTVAAVDKAPVLVTVVTALRWLIGGRREAFWFFPAAGVGRSEHDRLALLGERLAAELAGPAAKSGPELAEGIRQLLGSQEAAPLVTHLAASDLVAGAAFRRFGAAIRRCRTRAARTALLLAFVTLLGVGIVVVVPVLTLTSALPGPGSGSSGQANGTAVAPPPPPV
jgi:hypothetical protein